MKTALVLEGGAKRGIYTAGVLDVLLENGIMTDGVLGVSAGAIHGCSYVARQAGRSIRYNLKYGGDYRFMSFRSLLLSGNMVDTQFCYHELPEKLDPFDNETFMHSKTKFYAVCSNVETGSPEYVLCRDMFKDIDFLRASASMPFVSQIVKAGGMKLLDGGITDSIPLTAAFNLGFERNIVVQTRPEGYRKKPARTGWLAKMFYGKYPKFVEAIKQRHLMYNRELDGIEQMRAAGLVLVIRPSRSVKIGKMEPNPEIVREMYELGRYDAIAVLDSVKNSCKETKMKKVKITVLKNILTRNLPPSTARKASAPVRCCGRGRCFMPIMRNRKVLRRGLEGYLPVCLCFGARCGERSFLLRRLD